MSDVTLPTRDEIRQLPRWARVAFAARCARRALPWFQKHWPNAPQKHVESVNRAVIFAAQSAHAADAYAADAADIAYAAAVRAARAADADTAAGCAGDAARGTARAAAAAGDAAASTAASAAAYATADAAAHAGVPLAPIRADFQHILDLSRREKWTDDTPVPQSMFGPLDPDTEPPTEVVETADPFRGRKFKLIVDAYATDDADPQEVREHLVGLFRELNEYSLLKWGKGLTIDEFKQYLLAGVPEVVS